MLMRSLRLALLVCSLFGAVCLHTGCASFTRPVADGGTDAQAGTHSLAHTNQATQTSDKHEELATSPNQLTDEADRQMRARRIAEFKQDPLDYLLSSPQARDIDRSLSRARD